MKRGLQKEDVIVPEDKLIDRQLIQEIQERFCEANDLYTLCLDKNRDYIEELYGKEEEKAFIRAAVSEEIYASLIERLYTNEVEDLIEEPLAEENIKLCGAVVRMGGKPMAVWVAFAVLDDAGTLS